jgi:peptidyl-prolyl cis-trans isomerase D
VKPRGLDPLGERPTDAKHETGRLLDAGALYYTASGVEAARQPKVSAAAPKGSQPMLSVLRDFSKTWYAKILFVVLMIAFGGWGVNGLIHAKINDDVVTAGSRSLSQAEFKRLFDNRKRQWEQEQNNGQPVQMEDFAKAGGVSGITDQITTQTAFTAWLEKIGLKPSQKLIDDITAHEPGFINEVTRVFDVKKYTEALAQQGLTPETYTRDVSDQISAEHFIAGLRAGLVLPRVYGALQASSALETRDASWIVIDPKSVTPPAKPDDAQLQKYIAENASRFHHPEMRIATAILFTQQAVMKSVTVDDADLKKAYEFNKQSLSTPEKRSFVLLAARDPQSAAGIASALKAGGDPASVAKAAKAQLISVDEKPKSAVPDEAVAAAAFAMKPGDVSQPIRGSLGWAVIKLSLVTPGHETTFEEARPQLEQTARQKLASAKVEDLVEKYQALRDKGVSMADAAKQLELKVETLPPFGQDGNGPGGQPYHTPDGRPVVMPKPLIEALFSHPKGGDTDVEETGGGDYFALHIDEVKAAGVPVVDDSSREALTGAWLREQLIATLKAKADAVAARLRKGESIQAVASSINAKVETRSAFGRPHKQDEPDAMARFNAFVGAPGDAFEVLDPHVGYIVGRVDAVHGPATVIAAQGVEQIRPRMTSMAFQDLTRAAFTAARDQVKAKVDPTLRDAALSIAPTPAPGAAKKK